MEYRKRSILLKKTVTPGASTVHAKGLAVSPFLSGGGMFLNCISLYSFCDKPTEDGTAGNGGFTLYRLQCKGWMRV